MTHTTGPASQKYKVPTRLWMMIAGLAMIALVMHLWNDHQRGHITWKGIPAQLGIILLAFGAWCGGRYGTRDWRHIVPLAAAIVLVIADFVLLIR